MNLLDIAGKVLSEGEICDHCLGRRFGELSHGLTNQERGRSLRIAIWLENDDDFIEPVPEKCWVCGGIFTDIGVWVDRVEGKMEDVEFRDFHIGTRVPPLIEENEKLLDEIDGGEYSERFKSEFNREIGRRVENDLGKNVDLKKPDVVAIIDLNENEVELQINPLYIFGRYRKLVRDIPQTEWPCRECRGSGKDGGEKCERCGGSGYMYEESVEELIRPEVLEATSGEEMLFHGAGREDVDARMLGDGRPFVVEVKNPRRRAIDLDKLARDIDEYADGKVEVRSLKFVESNMVERVKEMDASKVYRAKVSVLNGVGEEELSSAIHELDGVTVSQRTPRRVSHRRADLVRERAVISLDGGLRDNGSIWLEIHGEGGLYVKEFVSGDNGRTEPSLSGILGVDLEVEELDVLSVKDDLNI